MSIPRQDELLLTITNRTATVLGGGLPAETHGKEKKAFHELRVIVWLATIEEINQLLDPKVTIMPRAYNLIFNDEGNLNMPDATLEFEIRTGITGTLKLHGLGKPMEFDKARVVGNANRVEFSNGGRAKLSLTFRFDAGSTSARVVELINRQECELEFQEDQPEDGALPAPNDTQGELKV